MLYESDIKSKDFSIALPRIIRKLDTIKNILIGGYALGDEDTMDKGFGFMIDDIADELRQVNQALYPGVEKESD